VTWRPPSGVLGELVAAARVDCDARRKSRPGLESEARPKRSPGRFRSALVEKDSPGFPLICEVKRASPAAGVLRTEVDVAQLAQSYAEAGARCLSVLTEGRRFGGSLEDLRAARAAVPIPLMRKDFIVDGYMIYEAADSGADCVLLIAAAVEPTALVELAEVAESLDLDVLLELIYLRDLEVIGRREWPLIGINARDLETLEVDPERFGMLASLVKKPGRLLVAESGIQTVEDIERVKSHGATAALVGEALMRRKDPGSLIRAFAAAGRTEAP
jgi:indole-3-glycerol phosphate synthase